MDPAIANLIRTIGTAMVASAIAYLIIFPVPKKAKAHVTGFSSNHMLGHAELFLLATNRLY